MEKIHIKIDNEQKRFISLCGKSLSDIIHDYDYLESMKMFLQHPQVNKPYLCKECQSNPQYQELLLRHL